MQFSSIGRQVFTKFLRKNALLFSSPPGGQQSQSQPRSTKGGSSNSTKLLDSQQQQELQSQVPQEDAETATDRRLNLSLALSKNVRSHLPPLPVLDKRMLTSVAFTGAGKPTMSSSRLCLPASRNSILMTQSSEPWSWYRNSVPNVSTSSSRGLNTQILTNLDEEGKVFEAVSLAEMKRFFRKHEIPFEDGYTCLRVDCFFCKKNQRKKKSFPWDMDKLYVNKTTGYFVCINCKITGTWKNLQDLIILSKSGQQGWTKAALDVLKKGDPLLKYEDKLNDLETNSREISTLTAEEWTEIAGRFGLEKLSKSVLEQYEMRHNLVEDQLLLPIYSVELKRVGYQIFKLSPKSGELVASTVPRKCNEIFGWKPVLKALSSTTLSSKSKPIILVQSALDVLAVATGSSHLPLGLHPECHHLPQEFLPKLEHFDDIILWFGIDVRSWETAKAFGRKLEERRCRLIRPIDLHPSPFIALQQDHNIIKILSSAQPMEHKAITTFSKLREEVLSELNHQDQVAGVKWTRYPYMTKLLKGHRRGELTILTGGTGSGKTTFMSEYSLDLCIHGVNTLWGSFEIRNVRLAKTMLTQFAEIDLEKHIDQYDSWADKFEKLPLYFMTFHGQQSVKAVLDAMTHAAYVYDIGHVVVDNLQFMLGVSENQGGNMDRFWRQDLIVAAFRKFATVNNCHVTLVMHPRKEGTDVELSNSSIFGGAKASQEADNILILQDRRLTSPRGKKYLQVTKNRFSGDLGMFVLEFNRDCLSFVTKKKPRTDQSVLVKPMNDETKSSSASSSNSSTNSDSFLSDENQYP